jgi:hypothetical protein
LPAPARRRVGWGWTNRPSVRSGGAVCCAAAGRRVVDLAGQEPLQPADDLEFGVALGGLFGGVGLGAFIDPATLRSRSCAAPGWLAGPRRGSSGAAGSCRRRRAAAPHRTASRRLVRYGSGPGYRRESPAAAPAVSMPMQQEASSCGASSRTSGSMRASRSAISSFRSRMRRASDFNETRVATTGSQ